MSDSIWDGGDNPPEDMTATIQGYVDEADARNLRIVAFNDAVREMPGKLGELLRQIAHAYSEFVSVESFGGTTAGEETRLYGVMDEAMSTLDWLQEGQS